MSESTADRPHQQLYDKRGSGLLRIHPYKLEDAIHKPRSGADLKASMDRLQENFAVGYPTLAAVRSPWEHPKERPHIERGIALSWLLLEECVAQPKFLPDSHSMLDELLLPEFDTRNDRSRDITRLRDEFVELRHRTKALPGTFTPEVVKRSQRTLSTQINRHLINFGFPQGALTTAVDNLEIPTKLAPARYGATILSLSAWAVQPIDLHK